MVMRHCSQWVVSQAARIEEYQRRRDVWVFRKDRDNGLFNRIGNYRLLVAVVAALLLYFIFAAHSLSAFTLILPIAAFLMLAVWHSRVARRRTLADRAIRHYDRGLARMTDKWAGSGQTGGRFRTNQHIYAEDLDIFGAGGLFELLANTRTSAGEEMLARWLLAPAAVAEVAARQQAVTELVERLDLREDLALMGPDIQNEVHIDACDAWAALPAVYFPAALRPVCAILSSVAILLVIGYLAQVIPLFVLLVIAATNAAIGIVFRKRAIAVHQGAETAGHGLPVLASALERFEQEQFHCAKLQELRSRLEVQGTSASKRIRRLSRWIDWLDSSEHVLIRVLGPIILSREQIAMGLEHWRRVSGPYLSGWLRTIGELEALSSLAALSYEHPGWTFPQLSSDHGVFVARQLRHPLLPQGRAVANDVSFRRPLQVLILSGSNMSGKSTLLRAIGLNAVLAWAGAPVPSESLLLSPLQTAASIRVVDSLADNKSRFLAEITRLKEILDLTLQGTVLFLLDEILSGTNSHDRRIGAAALIQKLVSNGAVGLVTTHDLALSEIENDLGSRAQNVHFEDRIRNGEVEFDYLLKPGIVTHSNALELMRAVGLEV